VSACITSVSSFANGLTARPLDSPPSAVSCTRTSTASTYAASPPKARMPTRSISPTSARAFVWPAPTSCPLVRALSGTSHHALHGITTKRTAHMYGVCCTAAAHTAALALICGARFSREHRRRRLTTREADPGQKRALTRVMIIMSHTTKRGVYGVRTRYSSHRRLVHAVLRGVQTLW
jgi:hypothetical protein